jgi:hypothetical protein
MADDKSCEHRLAQPVAARRERLNQNVIKRPEVREPGNSS